MGSRQGLLEGPEIGVVLPLRSRCVYKIDIDGRGDGMFGATMLWASTLHCAHRIQSVGLLPDQRMVLSQVRGHETSL